MINYVSIFSSVCIYILHIYVMCICIYIYMSCVYIYVMYIYICTCHMYIYILNYICICCICCVYIYICTRPCHPPPPYVRHLEAISQAKRLWINTNQKAAKQTTGAGDKSYMQYCQYKELQVTATCIETP